MIIGKCCLVEGCHFFLLGKNNRIEIGDGCFLDRSEFIVEGDGNTIRIGRETQTNCLSRFSAIEGTKIIIGERCLLSADINARTGDSHWIFDSKNHRLNQPRDIVIGSHVWIGYHVIILKGSQIPDECIVGSGSVITAASGLDSAPHSVFAGVPGHVIEKGISWDR